MDIGLVRQRIAEVVKDTVDAPAGCPDLTCYGYFPNKITAPAFYVGEVDIDFTGAMNRGMDILEVTARVLIGRTEDRSSQRHLDAFLSGSGPASLKAAIEGTPGVPQNLGGACDDLMVMRVQGYRQYEHAGVKFVGAEIIIKVVGSGT